MFAIAAVVAGACFPQLAPEGNGFRTDLDRFVETIERTHPEWTHAHPRARWDAAIGELRAKVDELDETRFAIGLMRLVHLLEDGHSRIELESSPLVEQLFPVVFVNFADGLYVGAAGPGLAAIVGARVVAIGGQDVDVALDGVLRLVSAENRASALERARPLLRSGAVQRELGLTDDASRGRITIEKSGGAREEIVLTAAPGRFFGPSPGWLEMGRAPSATTALAKKHPGETFWFECLDEEWAVWCRIDAIQDPGGGTFADACARLFRFIEENEIERLVIDLRENGGGNNYLVQPLIHGLLRCDRVNRPGRLFVLTSPLTYSAAVCCAARLERETFALFVGEPTGAGPNHFGDAVRFVLPATGLAVFCSTLRWQDSDPRDRRRAMLPDVPADRRSVDWSTGGDAALEAALAFQPEDLAWFAEFARSPPIVHWQRASQTRPAR